MAGVAPALCRLGPPKLDSALLLGPLHSRMPPRLRLRFPGVWRPPAPKLRKMPQGPHPGHSSGGEWLKLSESLAALTDPDIVAQFKMDGLMINSGGRAMFRKFDF